MIKTKTLLPKNIHFLLVQESEIVTLLKQCQSLYTIKQIHALLITSSIYKPNHLLSKLVELKDLSYASLHFSRILHPNDFSYNLMIRGLTTFWGNYPLAIQFYLQMIKADQKPNSYTYPFVLIASANLQNLYYGQTAHASVFKIGLHNNDHVQHSLITMYARCHNSASACQVFEEISTKDSVSWNSMISGYVKAGNAKDAMVLFERMGENGFEPNEVTIVSVLAACGDMGDLDKGMKLENLVKEKGLEFSSFVWCALIDMYGKCGDLISARRIFDGMKRKDVVSWNTMITGYAQNGYSDEAIALFYAMREARIVPDKITLVGVLSACAVVGALELGTWIDTCAAENGLYSNVYVGTALIDMYAKCGNLDRSFKVFDIMPHKNIVTWNCMISALASHGLGKEALSLFTRMISEDGSLLPNDITFIGVLSACVHVGLVKEGRQWFDSMRSVYGVVPTVEHYSCMVDLLARNGLLQEAWDLVEKMPGKPDEIVLGALLSACRHHKNIDIGDKVSKLILQLDPSSSANYVISSKIYAGSRLWDDSARIRGLMREKGVTKVPGCSWTEVDNQVHQFFASDDLHISILDIYQMTELLIEEMKKEGYIPNTELS